MVSQVTAFISRRWRVPTELLRVDVQALHGGLESAVARARISKPEGHSSIPPQLVIKQLPAGFEREGDVYELLWRHFDRPPAVRLLGREMVAQATYLYLEDAQPSASWPWSDARRAGAVCQALARLHDDGTLPHGAFSWDYETDLARSAQLTLELATDARDTADERWWRRVGDLRRVVTALPRIRRRLLSGETTVIHGDMHPGNAILRVGADPEVVLIDWARPESDRHWKTPRHGCIRWAAGSRRRDAATIR